MSELVAKVEPVVAGLGYDAKIADDIRAALTTRLRGLSTGPKGRLFDVQSSDAAGDPPRHTDHPRALKHRR